jgi:hypothetical protein
MNKEPYPLFLVNLEFSIDQWKYRKFWRQKLLQLQMNLNLIIAIYIEALKTHISNNEYMKSDLQHIQSFKSSKELFWNLAKVSKLVNDETSSFLRVRYCMCTFTHYSEIFSKEVQS